MSLLENVALLLNGLSEVLQDKRRRNELFEVCDSIENVPKIQASQPWDTLTPPEIEKLCQAAVATSVIQICLAQVNADGAISQPEVMYVRSNLTKLIQQVKASNSLLALPAAINTISDVQSVSAVFESLPRQLFTAGGCGGSLSALPRLMAAIDHLSDKPLLPTYLKTIREVCTESAEADGISPEEEKILNGLRKVEEQCAEIATVATTMTRDSRRAEHSEQNMIFKCLLFGSIALNAVLLLILLFPSKPVVVESEPLVTVDEMMKFKGDERRLELREMQLEREKFRVRDKEGELANLGEMLQDREAKVFSETQRIEASDVFAVEKILTAVKHDRDVLIEDLHSTEEHLADAVEANQRLMQSIRQRKKENEELIETKAERDRLAALRTARSSQPSSYSTSYGRVYVRGYYRKDGTYVRPHYRSR
ncbi:MAG: hypothetical protein ABJZ55_20215 [Fuerstiella sp.]